MTPKPVMRRARADLDVQQAVEHLLAQEAQTAALKFINALERAYAHVSRQPAAGSPRIGEELDLPGLRCWPVKGFPYLVFYRETDTHVDVWRVLHTARDLPDFLRP